MNKSRTKVKSTDIKNYTNCLSEDLDVFNEGCGCTCRECDAWHKELLDNQDRTKNNI